MTATVSQIHPERSDDTAVTSPALCQQSGITYRQLDYWTRCGHLHPHGDATPGNGIPRRYPAVEVDVASLAKRLIDAGFNPVPALALARQLVETGHQINLADGLIHLACTKEQAC